MINSEKFQGPHFAKKKEATVYTPMIPEARRPWLQKLQQTAFCGSILPQSNVPQKKNEKISAGSGIGQHYLPILWHTLDELNNIGKIVFMHQTVRTAAGVPTGKKCRSYSLSAILTQYGDGSMEESCSTYPPFENHSR